MFPRFEVRVGEAEEDFFELVLQEEVGEEFHCVGAEGGDVLVGVCWGGGSKRLGAEGGDFFLHVGGYGGADFLGGD